MALGADRGLVVQRDSESRVHMETCRVLPLSLVKRCKTSTIVKQAFLASCIIETISCEVNLCAQFLVHVLFGIWAGFLLSL